MIACGSRTQIASLNEGSPEANACNTLFTPTFEQLARAAHWNCLKQQVFLSLLEAAAGTPENMNGTTLPLPPQPWLYAYQLPADCLDVRYLLPNYTSNNGNYLGGAFLVAANCSTNKFQIPFSVSYTLDGNGNPLQVILTNLTQAQLIYTVNQPNPALWDSLFQAAIVASLAAFLVPALNMNMALMQAQTAIAERIIAQARIRDGNEGVTSQNRNSEWVAARNTGYGDYYSTGYNYNMN